MQAKQKYYDWSTKRLPSPDPGQSVWIQNPKKSKWEPAEVENKITDVPRSYNLSMDDGRDRELRRNRSHIRERNHGRVQFNLDQTPSPAPPRDEERNLDQDVGSPHAAQRSELVGGTIDHYTTSGRVVKPPVRLNL